MKSTASDLFTWGFLKIFPAMPSRVESAKKTLRRQASMAVEVSIAFAYVSVFLAILFAISILCYTAFYFWIMPEIRHEIPLYLQYDDCGDSAFASSATPESMPVDSRCHYPNAVVNFTALDAALFLPERYVRNRAGTDVHILMPGQKYSFFLNILLPESEQNRSLGMFMVSMVAQTNHAADGNKSGMPTELLRTTRHALLRYKSIMRRVVENALLAPLFVLDWRDETQRIKVPLVEAYYESQTSPTTSLTVQINKRRIELYDASIVIEAQLEGVKYWMYRHRIIVGIVIVGCNFLLLSLITVISFIHRAMSRSSRPEKLSSTSTSQPYTKVPADRRKPNQNFGREEDGMSFSGSMQQHASEYEGAGLTAAVDKIRKPNTLDFVEEFESYDALDDISPSHQRSVPVSAKTRRVEEKHAAFLQSLARYSNAAGENDAQDGINRAQPASRTTTGGLDADRLSLVSQQNRPSSSSKHRNLSLGFQSSSDMLFAHGTEAEKRASVRAFLDELRRERVAVHRTTSNSHASYSAVQPFGAGGNLYDRSLSDVIRGVGVDRRRRSTRAARDTDSMGSILGQGSIDDYGGGGGSVTSVGLNYGKSVEGLRSAAILPEIAESGSRRMSATRRTLRNSQQRQYSSGSSASTVSSTGSTADLVQVGEDDLDSGVGSRAATMTGGDTSGLQRMLMEQQRVAREKTGYGGKPRRRRSNTSINTLR